MSLLVFRRDFLVENIFRYLKLATRLDVYGNAVL